MKLPFTSEQFLNLFRDYNQSIFPLQILFYVIAVVIILLCIREKRHSDKLVNGLLAFFWFWMGIAYHLVFFTSINKAAYIFGAAFIGQGILFLFYGVLKNSLKYKASLKGPGLLGTLFIIFALVIYPLLGIQFGHIYPSSPTFGLPCPTTIFTFGILLWIQGPIPKSILVVPVLWSIVGFSAAIKLGMTEDISLLISGIFIAATALLSKRSQTTHHFR